GWPMLGGMRVDDITGHVGPTKRALGLALTAIPAGFAVAALTRLAGVFRRYARGEIFAQSAIDGLRAVGRLAVGAVVAKILVAPALSVAMTFDNPPGQKMLNLALSSNDLVFLIVAATFTVIASVMSEARAISDDLDQIV
ncbi:MAG: DUF2975 domain-containing protein, partial [Caulobacterales bacterium]|nr:DUF2975 domain-containing protein [Caulobacterales bacterium]